MKVVEVFFFVCVDGLGGQECELWRMGHEEFNQAVEGPICEYMKARIELQNTKVDLEWHAQGMLNKGLEDLEDIT